MAQLQIETELSVAGALAAGATEHGYLLVSPTAEQLQSLTDNQRKRLSQYVLLPHVRGQRLSVSQPGWAGVVAALLAQEAHEREQAAEREANIERERASYRAILAHGRYFVPGSMPPKKIDLKKVVGVEWDWAPNYSKDDPEARQLWSKIRSAENAEYARLVREADERLEYDVVNDDLAPPIKAVLSAALEAAGGSGAKRSDYAPRAVSFEQRLLEEIRMRAEETAKANLAAERELLAKHGTQSQRERYGEGVLPDREFVDIVIHALFPDLPLFDEISEQEVAEECECALDEVRFSSKTIETPPLSEEEFERLKAIREAAPKGATIEIRDHVGYQKGKVDADDPEIRRRGVRVTVEFAGRKYSQEYAL